jgi:integrase
MRRVKRPMPTMREIQALPPGRPLYLGNGLLLKTTPTSRTWMYRYKKPTTGKYTEVSIGPWPEYGYSSARQVATQLHVLVLQGKDPVVEARKRKGSKTTFAEACEGWINQHRSRWRTTRRLKTSIGKYAQSIADLPVRTIDRPMVIKALTPLWGKHPEQGYRTSTVWARVFDFATVMGYRDDEQANPARWRGNLEHVFHRPKNNNHYESLPFQEVPEFMGRLRLRQVKGHSAAALEFIALTASRPGEVLGMKWSEIDLVNRILTLPPERTKQKRQHRVPLSNRCMEIIALQKEYRTGDLVFPGRYRGEPLHLSSLHALLKKMDVCADPHGFRRSFRNWAFHTRQDPDLADLALGHKITNRTQGAYLTEDGLNERRPIMEAWAKFCDPSS